MKLLLTSAGITNQTLLDAAKQLAGEDNHVAFIPTAANVEAGDKDWLITNLVECQQLGVVDIVDISALNKKQWLPRLQEATILVVGGGDTTHLIACMRESGLAEELPALLENRVYIGISAGSIATNGTLATSSEYLYADETAEITDGLGLVDFYTVPHLNSKYFPQAREENLKEVARKLPGVLYALDDNSAIQVNNGEVTVVSEGKWLKLD